MNSQSKMSRHIETISTIMVNTIRILFPPAYIPIIKHQAGKNGNRILKLSPVSILRHCTDDKVRIVEEACERVVFEPAYYPDKKGIEHRFRVPSVYIAEMSDVAVHGGTGLIITGCQALTDVCDNDKENRIQYAYGPIRIGSKKAFYVEVSDDEEEIDTAISLCGLASSNYFHLTFEILSRYGYIREVYGDNSVTVLLDQDAARFPQFVDLIHAVLEDASIKFVPEYSLIRCNKLIYASMNTWMPLNIRKKNDFRISDNVIASSAIENIRRVTDKYRLERTDRKVFISRKNSSLSRILNEKEVEKLFIQAGYESVSVEELTYREQVELFSSAACVVGATGAALTNLVYCNPGAVIGCIFARSSNFCIYSSIAHMVGCECLFFDADVEKGTTISNWQYRVDMKECEGYISALDNLIAANSKEYENT